MRKGVADLHFLAVRLDTLRGSSCPKSVLRSPLISHHSFDSMHAVPPQAPLRAKRQHRVARAPETDAEASSCLFTLRVEPDLALHTSAWPPIQGEVRRKAESAHEVYACCGNASNFHFTRIEAVGRRCQVASLNEQLHAQCAGLQH